LRPFKIIEDLCENCKLCIIQCKRDKIYVKNGKVFVDPESDDCIACGHCYAICPKQAILTENIKFPELIKKSYNIDPENLLGFLRKRRSHRHYLDKEVPLETIKKILEAGSYAPTGSNKQETTFIVINSREKIREIVKEIMSVYKMFFKLLNNKILNKILPIIDKRAKDKKLILDLKRMIDLYENGKDPIFYNAPLVIFVAADKKKSSTPYDDSVYSLYNMVLFSESIGIASCINALAVIAIKFNKRIKKILQLKKEQKVYTSASFGYPMYNYKSLVFRKSPDYKIINT